MIYKSKNFTVKYYYHDEEENVNIYKVIDNKTKKRIYTGWFKECVNFVKEKRKDKIMKNNNYYGVYTSPYVNDGEPYVGSPETSEEACYAACGTDEVCLAVFDNQVDAYQRCQYETYKDIYDDLEEQCNEKNLQFQEDWVHIDTEMGVATVQNEYGRTLASLRF